METKWGIFIGVAILALLLCTTSRQAVAQANKWEKTELSQYLRAIVPDKNDTVYAAGDGLHRSTDAGATWRKIETGIIQPIVAFGVHPQGALFACAGSGVYRSTDHGQSWVKCFDGSPHPVFGVGFAPAGIIYVTNGNGGIHRSADLGATWQKVQIAGNFRACTTLDINFEIICVADTNIGGGIMESFDQGNKWITINGLLPYKNILALLVTPSKQILAGTRQLGILSLPLNDYRVYQMNTGLQSLGFTDLALAPNGDIFASSNETGVYRSSDDGKTWSQINRGLSSGRISALAVDQSYRLYAGTVDDGLYRRMASQTVAPPAPVLLSPDNHALLHATSLRAQWQPSAGAEIYRVQVAYDTTASTFLVDQDSLSLTYYDLAVLPFEHDYYWRVQASNPEGINWSTWWKFSLTRATTNTPLPLWPPNDATDLTLPLTLRWNIVAGAISYSVKVALAPDPIAPDSWVINSGNIDTLFQVLGLYSKQTYHWWVEANFSDKAPQLLSLPWKFKARGTEPSDSWIAQASGTTQHLNAVDFVDQNQGWAVGDSGTILHTVDGGLNWQRQNANLKAPLRAVTFLDAQNGFIVGGERTLLRTRNGGSTWTRQLLAASELISVCAANSDTIFVADSYAQMFRTFDGGATWQTNTFPYNNIQFSDMYFADSKNGWLMGSIDRSCRFCFSSTKTFHTTDGGQNWAEILSGNGISKNALFFSGPLQGWRVYEAQRDEFYGYPGRGGIAMTLDAGVSWQGQFSYSGVSFRAIHMVTTASGTSVGNAGMILHTSDGEHWNLQKSGTTTDLNSVDFVDAQNGWVVGNGGIILRTRNGGDVAVDDPGDNRRPEEFSLLQNYPNPFNPATSIEFFLPHQSVVTLKIFNVKGEEVTTLAAGEYPPGRHRVVWQASDVASGVYLYRLQAGDFYETKKMLIVR